MARLIDAEALKAELTGRIALPDWVLTAVLHIIENAPRVEITEEQARPTGEWYYNCQNGWLCSICQQTVKDMPTFMRKANFDYCPNCGAKMKEAENEQV